MMFSLDLDIVNLFHTTENKKAVVNICIFIERFIQNTLTNNLSLPFVCSTFGSSLVSKAIMHSTVKFYIG